MTADEARRFAPSVLVAPVEASPAVVPVTLLALAMTAQAVTQQATPKTPLKHGCLASGEGYLRTRLRGALQLDVNLKNAELDCDGGPRPDGSGIRVSFAGPLRSDGRRLRMVAHQVLQRIEQAAAVIIDRKN